MPSTPPNLRSPDPVSAGILVVGCGYLGRRVAQKARVFGEKVFATTRKPETAAELRAEGIEPRIADWTDPSTLLDLPAVDKILVSVSYDPHSNQTRHASQVGGLANLLQAVSPRAHVCYISTTGVYSQSDGQWVDEDSPARPSREGGRVHLEAEGLLGQLRPDSPWTVLRLAGIYGPGRVPRVNDVIAGRPIAAHREGYLNLIHVDDAASAVIASWSQSKHRLYLISDDVPVRRSQFYDLIAAKCDAAAPRFVEPDDSEPARKRSAANRRICNRRMKQDLLPQLAFPSYREGLASVL